MVKLESSHLGYFVTFCLAVYFAYVCHESYTKLMNPVVITVTREESSADGSVPMPSFTFFAIDFTAKHDHLNPGSGLTLEEVYTQTLPKASDFVLYSLPSGYIFALLK